MSEYLYGKLNKLVEQAEYKGSTTSTARVNVDNTKHEISVDVLNPVNQDLTGALLYNKEQDLNNAQINQVHSNLKLNDFINNNAIVPNKSNQTISGDLQISGKLTTKSLTVSDNSIVIEKYDEENDAIIYVTSNGILKYNNGKLNQAVVTLSDGIKADKFLKYNGETVISEDIYPKDINTKNYTPKNTTDITTKDYVDKAVRKDTNYSIVETFNDFNTGASWVGKRVLVKEDINDIEDIKDRVYINNDYIFDYYLTSEKVNEFKQLKSDFEEEVSNRENNDLELNSNINRVQSNLDTINTNLTNNISDLRNYSDSTFETIVNANIAHSSLENDVAAVQENIVNTETNLTNTINKEITDRENADTELRELIDQNTAKTEKLDSKIDSEVEILNQTINTTVTGANKWIAPVNTESDLVIPEDRRFNYLCKVIDTGYTYQLLIDSDSWVLYSKTEDYIDPIELSSSIETHNTSIEAHSDIRQEIESLSERVDGLPTDSNIQSLADRITATENNIDTLQSEAHTHINKDLLDTYTQTEANLADAVIKKHEHLNKAILDNTTASYTEEEKEKLANLNSNNYEKLSNKVTEITDAVTNDNYPSALAVKNYIDTNGGNIDTSNLVTLNTAQEITGGKTFTNLYISNGSGNTVSISTDSDNNINLTSNSASNIKLNVNAIEISNLYYNGYKYGIYNSGIDDSLALNRLLVTADMLSNGSGSDYNIFVSYIVSSQSDKNIITTEDLYAGDKIIVLNDFYSYNDGSSSTIVNYPCVWEWDGESWVNQTPISTLFYSYKRINNLQISSGYYLYGVEVDDAGLNATAVQIYPAQVDSLTIQKNGSTIGTYTGSATTINVDLSEYALNSSLNSYVTTTSLNNTLNNYVTTTNLNTQLSTKLNINQGSENANKILMVDSNGNISLVDVSVSLTDNTIIFEANLQEN